MDTKPLCIASATAAFLISCALEGGGLSVGQAAAALAPVAGLLVWSFAQTDWYEPTDKEKAPTDAENIK